MSGTAFPPTGGFEHGPTRPDYWKTALYKQPPAKFTIEVLSAQKIGSAHSYGLRVCPLNSKRSSGSSGISRESFNEYEIWRRWEDYLFLQENLELTYSRLAREKRTRLANGKGVKKNGLYIQDHASSWESLPPGPDPKSIARDIHNYLPKMTKKGTVFRASQSTIDQRLKEVQAFMDALFSVDVPTLIKELLEDPTVTDFFGIWRRDHEFTQKSQLLTQNSNATSSPGKLRPSLSTSLFSSKHFSSSNSNVSNHASSTSDGIPSSNVSGSPRKSSGSGRPGTANSARPSTSNSSVRRPRTASDSSSSNPRSSVSSSSSGGATSASSSSSVSNGVSSRSQYWSSQLVVPSKASGSKIPEGSDPPAAEHSPNGDVNRASTQYSSDESVMLRTPTNIPLDIPLIYEHAPQYQQGERSLILEPLLEDDELRPQPQSLKGKEPMYARRLRSNSSPRSEVKSNRIVDDLSRNSGTTDPKHKEEGGQPASPPGSVPPPHRESWASNASGTSACLEGLDIALSVPVDLTCMRSRSRVSINSIATFMTNNSADAIIPGGGALPGRSRMSRRRSSSLGGVRSSRAFTIAEEGEEYSGDEEDYLDTCFFEPFPVPLPIIAPFKFETEPETPLATNITFDDDRAKRTPSDRSNSPTPSGISGRLLPPSLTPLPPKRPSISDERPSTALSNGITTTPTPSTLSSVGTISPGPTLTLKVASGPSIVLLRVSRDIALAELRQKIHDKFVRQEGVPLSDTFRFACVSAAEGGAGPTGGRARAGSLSSGTAFDLTKLRCVTNELEWAQIAGSANSSNKLALRILDTAE